MSDDTSTFTCDNGDVLDASKQCDGYPDCLYGEDEQNCPYDDDGEEQEIDGDNSLDGNTGIPILCCD